MTSQNLDYDFQAPAQATHPPQADQWVSASEFHQWVADEIVRLEQAGKGRELADFYHNRVESSVRPSANMWSEGNEYAARKALEFMEVAHDVTVWDTLSLKLGGEKMGDHRYFSIKKCERVLVRMSHNNTACPPASKWYKKLQVGEWREIWKCEGVMYYSSPSGGGSRTETLYAHELVGG